MPTTEPDQHNTNAPNLVAGRACGDCRMCCKLPDIPELAKPIDTWCRHADLDRPDGGCKIYNDRPAVCRSFACGWLKGLGQERDRPDRLGVMWQPIQMPDGRPGLAFVESEPGALGKPRVRRWLEQFNRSHPGRIAVRRFEEPRLAAVELRVNGRPTPEAKPTATPRAKLTARTAADQAATGAEIRVVAGRKANLLRRVGGL